jgi:hypothetical protein
MPGQDLAFRNVSYENALSGKFKFQVSNISDSNKTYSVAMEKLDETHKWKEVRGDVFNYSATKKTRIFNISPKNTNSHYFLPHQCISKAGNGKYRFKLTYGYKDDGNGKTMVNYSIDFVFK